MSPDEIRKIRDSLGLKQEDLALLLGVNKGTISRYESGQSLNLQADVRRNLEQLQAFMADEKQKNQILAILDAGGLAALAGILTIGAVTFPLVAAGAAPLITLAGLMTSPALKCLASFAASFLGDDGKKH